MSFSCRSCAGTKIQPVISLGKMALANSYLTREQLNQPELTYPLDVVFCDDCKLVQITETVPPETLFREYAYFSSYSDTMMQHAKELSEWIIEACSLGKGNLVAEIASNDGYLLQNFSAKGIGVLGIEPAKNIAQVAQQKGVRTVPEFFDEQLSRKLVDSEGNADVIFANNVLAHVADLNGFVRGIRNLLHPDGTAVIEVPYVKNLVDRCEFDTIYHEHLCYYSLTSLQALFERHDLTVKRVRHIPIHGGSLCMFVTHLSRAEPDNDVRALLAEEKETGMGSHKYYANFGTKVEHVRSQLLSLADSLKLEEMRIAGYGAAAKGSVLLNYCGLDTSYLDFVADKSAYKQGRFMPGVRIPISEPERLIKDMPDYTLLLAWNIGDEVMHQQAAYREKGGKFIIPIPEPRVV